MSSISGGRTMADGRSGGKIVKRRRTSVAKTPYDRPTANPPSPTQNPNWLTGLVLPATRKIATGAGLLISSIFTAETSSSSESSSSEADCFSEEDVDGRDSGDDMPYDVPAQLNAQNRISLEENPQLAEGKNNTKQLIEQLLIQEMYSRKECDRLISIISSRVVDLPTGTGGPDDIETPDIRSKAVSEAKKWLEEKKVGSSSKSELERSTHGLNSGLIHNGNSDDCGLGGSPVDMAKSFMQRRPPWSSPRHMMDLESTTLTPILLFDQQTPTSSIKQKKDSLASGSWNIREEIRRVRSKATEDMLLHTTAKSNLSVFSPQAPSCYSAQYSSLEETRLICPNYNISDSNSLPPAKPIQGASLTSTQGPPPHASIAVSVLEMLDHDDTKNEAPLIGVLPTKKQESEAMQIGEEGGAVSKSLHSIQEPLTLVDPSRPSEGNDCTTKDMVKISHAPNAENTSLAPTKSSLSAGVVDGENEKPNREGQDEESRRGSVRGVETYELIGEASMEVPDVNMETSNDKDSITSRLQAEQEEAVVKVGTVAVSRTPRRTPSVVVQNKPARIAKKGNRSRGGK